MESAFDVRRSIVKYNDLHERLWSRSRDAVARRNRIDASEKRQIESSGTEEERQFNQQLFTLRKRALDFNIKELAIEISHVSDVIESLQCVQAAQDTGATDLDEASVAHLAFERYEEWAGTNHELYCLRSQALEVASDIMRVRSQRPKLQEKPVDSEVDLCTALSRMRSHTQTLSSPSPGEDETDGHGFLGADNSAHAASSEEWWQRLLKSNTQRTSQQTYLRELFSLSGHVRTFESRKIVEYVEECQKFLGMAMERRIVAKDVAEYTRRASAASRRQSVEPPVGIQPGRFHEFVAALSYYVVEQQRKLHNEVWDEEEVQLILEEHIMSSVRPLARTYTERPAEDLRLKEVCEALASATQEQLGIPKEFASDELVPYYEAIALLRSMIFSLTPSKKLFCVASAANTVFKQLDKGGVKVQTVGADAFMDIWVYVIVKANVAELMSSIAFMSEYAVRSLSTGQAGYFLASLQVATSAIMELDVAKVLRPLDTGGRILVCQRSKYLQLAKQPNSPFEVVVPCQTLVGYRMCAVRQWLLDSAKFFSVLLEKCPDDPDAVVNVAIIRFNARNVAPSQLEFLKKVFLPTDQSGLYVEETPLGKALCLSGEPGALSLVRLNCTDYCDVDESLMQYVMLQRLGVSCDPSPRPAASADANTTTNGTDSSIAQSSPQPACEEFKPSLSVSLGARFREDYSIASNVMLSDGIYYIVTTTQAVCQHLEHLSSLAPVDGVYTDLVLAAVKAFKSAFKAENPTDGQFEPWSDDGVLTPEVFAAMKMTLNSYLEDLAHLGFLVPFGANACDPSERARTQVRHVITGCQRGWHLPIHVHGGLGKKTRQEIRRRMAMLTACAQSTQSRRQQ